MIGNVEDFSAYAVARGYEIVNGEGPVLLTKATDYLDTFKWVGSRPADQEDDWPRTGLVYRGTALLDMDGNVITGLTMGQTVTEPATPRNIINAVYRLGLEAKNGVELLPTIAGAQILEERVEGAITVKYSEASIGTPPTFSWFDGLVGPWLSVHASLVNFSVNRG